MHILDVFDSELSGSSSSCKFSGKDRFSLKEVGELFSSILLSRLFNSFSAIIGLASHLSLLWIFLNFFFHVFASVFTLAENLQAVVCVSHHNLHIWV